MKSIRQTDDDLSQQPGGVPGPKLGANPLTKSAVASGLWIIVGVAVLAGLFAVSRYNYLLFHSLIELFSVAVAWGVFLLVWNGRRFIQNEGLLFLGIAYLFIGSIDLVHTLAYKGMGVFQVENAPNLAIQLWVSARGLETVSLLLFPLFLTRKVRFLAIFLSYSIVTGLLILGIFACNVFPDCYVDGVGLTEFKIVSEYIICAVLLGAAGLLFWRRNQLDVGVFRLMIFSIFCTIIAEFFFTRYDNVYGLSNLIGHLFKLASFYLIYQALIHSGLVRPYTLLFQDLKNSEQKLRESTDLLNESQQVAGIGSFVWDMQADTMRFSESMTNITGADELFFQGSFTRAIQTLVHPDDQEYLLAEIDKMVAQKRMWSTKFRLLRPDGGIRYIESSSRFSFDENDAPVTVIGVLHDVTARKETEEEREITVQLLRIINSPNNTHELMQSVTSLLHEWSGCEAVGIRLKDGEDYPYFETRGFPQEFVLAENQLCQYTPEGNVVRDHCGNPVLECMCGNILCGRSNPELPFFTEGGSFWSNCTTDLLASTSEADRQSRTRNRCNGEGYESVALIPLRCSGETFGLFQLNDKRRNRFTKKRITLLEHLAGSLSIALAQRKTFDTIRTNRKELRALLDVNCESMALFEPDGRILECNVIFASRLGYNNEEIIGRNAYELIPPEVRESRRKAVQQVWETRESVQFEDVRNGRIMFTSLCPVLNAEGHVRAIAIYAEDITERKQTQIRLEQTLDATTDGIWYWHFPSKTMTFSPRYYTMLGYEPDEFPATFDNWGELIHPEDRASALALAEDYFRTNPDFYENEFRMRTKSGTYRQIHSKGKIVERSADGAAVLMIGNHEDITDLKKAEQEAEQKHAELQTIYDHSPVMMCTLDKKCQVLYANQAFKRFTGFTDDLKNGRACGVVLRCINAVDDRRGCGFGPKCKECKLRLAIEDTLKTGRNHHAVEYQITLEQDDGNREVTLIGATAMIHSMDHYRMLLCLHDVSEFRRVQQDYQLLFQQMLDGFALHEVICDDHGNPKDYRFLAVNPAFEQMTGLKAANIIGKTVLEVLPNVEKHWIETYGRVALTGKSFRFENYSQDLNRHFKVAAFQPTPGQFACIFIDITERKRAEEELKRYSELFDSIRKAQGLLFAQRDKREIFNSLLQSIVRLTDSEIGFLDEVLTDENGQRYKKNLAISNISWDEQSQRLYEQLQAQELKFTNLKNLAGCPALSGELVITNDVSHDPRSGGLPPGHPPLKTYMGIPMYLGGLIVGVVGIANRKEGYNKQLATFLQPFVSTCASIIEALQNAESKEVYQLRLRTLMAELTLVEERERKWIADLLHDSLGQSLSFAKVKLDVMAKADPSSRDTQTLLELSNELKTLIGQTRDLSFELSCPTLQIQGLAAAIQEYLSEEVGQKYKIDTHFECNALPKPLPENVNILLYRSIRELLANTIKHSQACQVTVRIQAVEDRMEIQVADDGVGFDQNHVPRGKGFGLISIRERLGFMGGSMEIQSQSGEGTRIIIHVPLDNGHQEQEDNQ